MPARRDTAPDDRLVLAAAQSAVAELRAILDAERLALDMRDSLALDAATSAKADLLQRLQLLGSGPEEADASGAAPSPTASAWRALRRQLDECRRVNTANGIIVEAQLRHVRRALHILGSGEAAPPHLYGPHGHVATPAPQRNLSTV